MRIAKGVSLACVVALILTGPVAVAQYAQAPPLPSPTTRLIPTSGTLTDAAGTPLTGAQTVTLALFDEAEGGTLLWSETQTVTADDRGRYLAYLGAGVSLPLEVFRSEQARWLQVSVAGRDLPRVMLVAVPYALKAADAETVGGKPASAFVLASDQPARGTEGTRPISAGSVALEPLATSGTPGAIAKFTSATDLGDSIIYQSGTGIGVNTSAPAALFHVRSEQTPAAFFDVYSNTLGALPVVYRAARGTANAPLPVQTNDILGGLAVRGYAPSGFTGGKGQIMFRAAENWTDTANGTVLQFMTTPTGSTTFAERMRINAAGNVGIGTTNPVGRLHVSTTSGYGVLAQATSGIAIEGDTYSAGGSGPAVVGTSYSGWGVYAYSETGTALYASSSGGIAAVFANGKVGIGTTNPLGRLGVSTTSGHGVWAETTSGAAVVGDTYSAGGSGPGVYGQSYSGFGVQALSATGPALDAVSQGGVAALFFSGGGPTIATFSGPGNVGIGTTSPVDKLHVAGDIRVGTGLVGCVKDANGSVIAGACSSDRRFKQAVTPFARSLETVARLQPVYFTWRADEFPERHFGHTRSFGLIAQEVEAVLPDLVTTDAEGYKAVKYHELPFHMLQAIKDLKAENDLLKSETDRLKQHLKMQEERLQRLEQTARR